VLVQMYDTLLFRDANLKLIPWLAESWRMVNPTTWEFKLRKGAKFHNGEDVDAEAVKYSLERIIDPNTKPQRQITCFNLVERVNGRGGQVHGAGDHHEALPGAREQPGAPGQHRPAEVLQVPRLRAPGQESRGLGPLQVVRWAKDEQIVMEANEQWWGGRPKIKTLIFRPILEHAVWVAGLGLSDPAQDQALSRSVRDRTLGIAAGLIQASPERWKRGSLRAPSRAPFQNCEKAPRAFPTAARR
jgi:peptide/nickel transport system substrate-binding protein